MALEALKLELIEWLSKLDDRSTIEYLKIVKDSAKKSEDWWDTISDEEKAGIDRGLEDVEEGRTHTHEFVKEKYGL